MRGTCCILSPGDGKPQVSSAALLIQYFCIPCGLLRRHLLRKCSPALLCCRLVGHPGLLLPLDLCQRCSHLC